MKWWCGEEKRKEKSNETKCKLTLTGCNIVQ
jgi:hypothetical protein